MTGGYDVDGYSESLKIDDIKSTLAMAVQRCLKLEIQKSIFVDSMIFQGEIV